MDAVYEEMLHEYRRRGLDGETLLRWAAFRTRHGGARDAAERFLLLMADVEYLARVRVHEREVISQVISKSRA